MSYDSEGVNRPASRAIGLGRFAPIVLRRVLARLECGRLTIVTPSGERLHRRADKPGAEAVLVLRRWRALRRLAFGGDVGFAEAYADGDWSSPDLTALIVLAAQNIRRVDAICPGLSPMRLLGRLRRGLRSNTRAKSRSNVAFHYDLGNDFYRLWLDPSMTYSAAYYEDPADSLERAQEVKLNKVLDALDIRDGDRILEIGCGWGTLAARMARRGARVTALTLSSEQRKYAQSLLSAEGCDATVEVRLQDYRETDGCFDAIASIEMLEAVGERYWPAYFETLRRRLRPGGAAALQVITIDESRFDGYRRSADFIQRHIFPGGMLPTKTIVENHARLAGLKIRSIESFGVSYALTLAEWRRRFLAAWPNVEKLGFDIGFRRFWEYYLCYCEAGFRTGLIDVTLYALDG